jgi:2-polyprenyl-3-methyl-5-hydroxy-6-metoxy-1,4-benzoquinol methylase
MLRAVRALEQVPCNVCGSRAARRLFTKQGFAIVRCRECGLGYVSPRSVGSDTVQLYQDERYYRNANADAFGYGDYLADRELLERNFDGRLDEIQRLRPPGRLLDVGCATGVLLERAAARGWSAEGIEVSAYAAAQCRMRGLRVHQGELASAGLPRASFDVIVVDNTIEHVDDPRRMIETLHDLLAPGGLLTLETPNEAGWLHFLMRRRWFHYKPREHLYFFSPRTLGRLLGESGFRVLGSRRTAKLVTLPYVGGRLRTYSPLASRVLLDVVGRLPLGHLHFPLPIGEFAIFAERPDAR